MCFIHKNCWEIPFRKLYLLVTPIVSVKNITDFEVKHFHNLHVCAGQAEEVALPDVGVCRCLKYKIHFFNTIRIYLIATNLVFLIRKSRVKFGFFWVFAIDNKSPEPVRFSLIFCLCPSIVAQKSFFLRSENPSVRPTNCMIYTRSFNFLPISSHWLSIFCEFVRR